MEIDEVFCLPINHSLSLSHTHTHTHLHKHPMPQGDLHPSLTGNRGLFVYLFSLFGLSAPSSVNPSLSVSHSHSHTLTHTHTHLNIDVKRARAGSVSTGERIEEVDAVGVVLLQGGHVQMSLLPRRPAWRVHYHEGTYGNRDNKEKGHGWWEYDRSSTSGRGFCHWKEKNTYMH